MLRPVFAMLRAGVDFLFFRETTRRRTVATLALGAVMGLLLLAREMDEVGRVRDSLL